jgi:hypothetical protein
MDCRVKPGNDEQFVSRARCSASFRKGYTLRCVRGTKP